ncbi:DUF1120 domain-containing protein [Pseudomonas resinovorans]|uniref:DUF1120 domain-containing protein n=1 Tax=Metapseudomonas resinovorans TaxID=53412 RepID=A0ABT4YCM3_METRE|nr:DUF1120 domain-containing protein [Pseudomonas resinovorans]MDA8486362.1 DUF1120 domain-containing protein [Pseudomonas resinovorans]
MTGGDFDLGTLSGNNLSFSNSNSLPEIKGKTLDITCSGATLVAFSVTDNRSSSVIRPGENPRNYYGLGVDSQGNKIGSYRPAHDGAIPAAADGSTAVFKHSTDDGVSWSTQSGIAISPSAFANNIYAISPPPDNTHSPITTASLPLSLAAKIQPLGTLDTSADITIDGYATFELVYL